jgi:Transcriptional Coactivator p15 (PC4)
MSPRPTLSEPVVVSRFWRSRAHDAIVTTLQTYEGHNLIDVRTHRMSQGRLVPTTQGISIVVLRLPELHKAITKALKTARDLGLIDDDGVGE